MKTRPRASISTITETGDPHWNGLPADYWIKTVKRWEQQIAKTVPMRDMGFGRKVSDGDHGYSRPEYMHGAWELLQTSRKLFLHSWCVADFSPLAVLVAYQAVESALQTVYYDHRRDSFEKLVDRAVRDGRLKGHDVEWTHYARQMRNLLSHPFHQIRPEAITTSAGEVALAHLLVIDLLRV